jgi:hypothetical protein
MNRFHTHLLAAAAGAALASVVAATSGSAPPPTPSPVSSPILPNPALTPGVVASTDAATVLKPGYSASVRNVPDSEKRRVFAEYGIKNPAPGAYEIDHLIPLSLGGSNDIHNLWPELYDGPLGAHAKDRVEDHLLHEVRAGHVSLTDAQQAIRSDWTAVYRAMPDAAKQATGPREPAAAGD